MKKVVYIAIVILNPGARAQDAPAWQTAAGGTMSFEVASVKPSGDAKFVPPAFPLDAGDAYKQNGGRFSADFPLSVYISFAYKLNLTPDERQAMVAKLPKWVASERFTIQAKAATENPTKDQMRLMMQTLLGERFGLKAHFETQEVPVFALTLVKSGKMGPKLKPHSEGPACDAEPSPGVVPPRCEVMMMVVRPNRMRMAGSRNTTIDLIAGALPTMTSTIGRPVLDQTGLSGRFDFTLEWTPEAADSGPQPAADSTVPEGPSFIQAVREQLGLKLDATRGPVRVLVVDQVKRPTEN